jgi:hypothetical protein
MGSENEQYPLSGKKQSILIGRKSDFAEKVGIYL